MLLFKCEWRQKTTLEYEINEIHALKPKLNMEIPIFKGTE